MAAGWHTTLLCKGCGRPLAFFFRNPETGQFDEIFEANKDEVGDFIRCSHCGGKNYYTEDNAGAPVFRNFEAGPAFYWLKRKLGLR